MNRWSVGIAVFVAAAAVLVLEIVAGRILAPYVGVSLQTFTGIIGTILAAIALGAWMGGRLADRFDPAKLIGPVLIIGAVLAVVSPALVYVLGPSAAGDSPASIVALAAIGFFLPAAVLSTVTPIGAKLSLRSLDATGSVVGQLSALGTAGALFGTFITGFVLIAAVPSQPITWVVGVVVLAIGVALSLGWGRGFLVSALAVFTIALMGSAALAAPCDYETAYSCAIVSDRQQGTTVKALILDTFVNSVVDTEDPTFLASRYARVIDAVVQAGAPGGPRSVVYIGGGGFTMPRYYHETAGSLATVLEIDAALPEISVEELGLVPGPWLRVHTGDARIELRSLADDQFDVAVGDAFSGRSVPWHLTTTEFVADIRSKLSPGGVYVMNLIDHPPLDFAQAEAATLADVFEHVILVAPEPYLAGERGGNFVLAGSDAPFDIDAVARGLEGEVVIVDGEVAAWSSGATVLSDEFAPVDQLLSRP